MMRVTMVVRIVVLISAMSMQAGCAAAASQHASSCFDFEVIVRVGDSTGRLVSPGIPLGLIIRGSTGAVLQRARVPAEGRLQLTLCGIDLAQARQLEVTMVTGDPSYVGAIASFANTSDTYCINMPAVQATGCGEWGTGPRR